MRRPPSREGLIRTLAAVFALLWTTFTGESTTAAAAIQVACVGDSITAGTAASSPAHAYPGVLSTLAGAGWNVVNFGNGGKTMIKAPSNGASYWDQVQFTQSQSFGPDIVLIMLGTNDSKTANWKNGANTFEADYRSMVAVYQGLSTHPRVYAMLPPPALSANYTIDASVIQNQIIPIIRRVASAAGIGIIDLNAAVSNDQPAMLLSADGIHPNDSGYLVIAQTVWQVIRGAATDGGPSDASPADATAPAFDADESSARSTDDASVLPGPSNEDATAAADVEPAEKSDGGPDLRESGSLEPLSSAASDARAMNPDDSGAPSPGPTGSEVPEPTALQSSSPGGCTCGAASRAPADVFGALSLAASFAGLLIARRRSAPHSPATRARLELCGDRVERWGASQRRRATQPRRAPL